MLTVAGNSVPEFARDQKIGQKSGRRAGEFRLSTGPIPGARFVRLPVPAPAGRVNGSTRGGLVYSGERPRSMARNRSRLFPDRSR